MYVWVQNIELIKHTMESAELNGIGEDMFVEVFQDITRRPEIGTIMRAISQQTVAHSLF